MKKIKIESLSMQEIKARGINNWPVWEKEISRFDWYYDSTEECFILEGEVNVETDEGLFTVKAGDFVTFSSGLKCVWNVKKAIRKHYNFP